MNKVIHEINIEKSDKILIDGIRNLRTFSLLKEKLSNKVGLIYIHTLPDIAYNLYKSRENPKHTFKEFLELRNSYVEQEVDDFMKNSDAVLYNLKGLQQYKKTIRKMIGTIMS